MKLFVNFLPLGNKLLNFEPVWDVVKDVRASGLDNFQVRLPSAAKVRYADIGDRSSMNTPKRIPLGCSFNQLLLHMPIDWVSGQRPNISGLDCVVNGVVLRHA